MAFLDFLFGGNKNQTTTTTQEIPAFQREALQDVYGRAFGAANAGYTPNPNPRVAGFSVPQTNAFKAADANFGNWTGAIGRAAGYTGQAANANALEAASPFIGQAGASLDRADGQSAVATAAPLVGQGIGRYTDNWQDYENPYRDQVTDRIAETTTRNLLERVLPGINDTFTGAGQFGSTRNEDFTLRAIRDNQNEVAGNVAQSLERGYTNSANIFGADQNRSLTGAQTLGNLTTADRQNDISSANARAGLGQLAGNLTDADARRRLDAARLSQNEAQVLQGLGRGDVDTLLQVGGMQQNQDQKNLDTLNRDFYEQRDWDRNNASFLSNIVRGNNTGSTTTTSAPPPSTLSQIAGIGTAAYGLSRLKKGGPAKRSKPAGIGGTVAARPLPGRKMPGRPVVQGLGGMKLGVA